MDIIIGSARIDERGKAYGGEAGDQKQTSTPDYRGEVSMQSFYVSSKGWYVFRFKNPVYANKAAKAMETACNNKNIGYDQYQRDNIIKNHTNSKVKTECDCSSLVRECIIEASGSDPGNIRTISMPSMLPKTGLFEDMKTYTSGMKLYTGDILVTKTSGHTVLVVKGYSRDGSDVPDTTNANVAKPTLKKGSKGNEVKKLQKNLNSLGYKDKNDKKLEVDGDFGNNTFTALKKFQKAYKIEVDGIYGQESYKVMKKAIG